MTCDYTDLRNTKPSMDSLRVKILYVVKRLLNVDMQMNISNTWTNLEKIFSPQGEFLCKNLICKLQGVSTIELRLHSGAASQTTSKPTSDLITSESTSHISNKILTTLITFNKNLNFEKTTTYAENDEPINPTTVLSIVTPTTPLEHINPLSTKSKAVYSTVYDETDDINNPSMDLPVVTSTSPLDHSNLLSSTSPTMYSTAELKVNCNCSGEIWKITSICLMVVILIIIFFWILTTIKCIKELKKRQRNIQNRHQIEMEADEIEEAL